MVIKHELYGKTFDDENVIEWDRCYINRFEITETKEGGLEIRDCGERLGTPMGIIPKVTNLVEIRRLEI